MTKEMPMKLRKGMRVRYDRDSLGASEPDDLGHVTSEHPKKGDEGVVLRPHDNRKMCRDWWWTEWTAPSGRKLIVGVLPTMVVPTEEPPAF